MNTSLAVLNNGRGQRDGMVVVARVKRIWASLNGCAVIA